jgi:hypothetical protein
MEIYQYQLNVDNYTVMLAGLPQDNWPDNFLSYKDAAIDKLPEGLDDVTVGMIADYQYRDKLRGLLRTEKVEYGRAGKIRDALKMQIGADYDSLIDAYKASQQG